MHIDPNCIRLEPGFNKKAGVLRVKKEGLGFRV